MNYWPRSLSLSSDRLFVQKDCPLLDDLKRLNGAMHIPNWTLGSSRHLTTSDYPPCGQFADEIAFPARPYALAPR